MSHPELVYQIALDQVSGIGPILARKLISHFGDCSKIFQAKEEELQAVEGLGPSIIKNLLEFSQFRVVENEVRQLEKNGVQPCFIQDSCYPYRLRHIPDAPILLFGKGQLEPRPQKTIAIVGTRRMTPYGASFIEELVRNLVHHDPLVVSGLAFGVDTQVHKCCMKHGIKTVGVMAHGHGHFYPVENKGMSREMLHNKGALLTECLFDQKAERENFPKRNRIVAGMVDAVLVVESAVKGGSMITARLANEYSRDVLAVPGRVNDYYSSGCNLLIYESSAHLCRSINDVESILNWTSKKPVGQTQLFEKPSPSELPLCKVLADGNPRSIDQIALQTNLSMPVISTHLLSLEFKGIIASLPGKHYQLLANRYDLEI
jgi:DNA processing protein